MGADFVCSGCGSTFVLDTADQPEYADSAWLLTLRWANQHARRCSWMDPAATGDIDTAEPPSTRVTLGPMDLPAAETSEDT